MLKKIAKILSGFFGLIALIAIGGGLTSKRKTKKIKKDIKENEKKTSDLSEKRKQVTKDRDNIQKEIEKSSSKIKVIGKSKPSVKKKTSDKALSSIKKRLK
tara:strand:+ start:1194 stop:1496 length:303 start_codon:yes stop_codon:yes gene_type:complete